MKILAAGGSGFIGTNFCELIQKTANHSIASFDKLTYASNQYGKIFEATELINGDLCDKSAVERAVKDFDVIVNFAAETHVDNSLESPEQFIDTNIIGTFNLISACATNNIRYHHISTDEVYGDLPLASSEKFTENSPYNPSSPYAASKASSDHLVRAWIRSFGLKATISNCSNNYGSYQHIEKFIPRQITNLLSGGNAKIYGAGRNVRDWIYVDDHCKAILGIIERGKIGETYLIGASEQHDNLSVARSILKLMNLDESRIEFVADRAGHDLRYAIDSSKIQNELGWKPGLNSFESGLSNTIEWYKANPGFWQDSKQDVESKYSEKGQ